MAGPADILAKLMGSAPNMGASATMPSAPEEEMPKRKDAAKLLEEFKPKYDNIKGNRIIFERQWYTNMAFFAGRQYVQWIASGAFAKLYEPPVPDWRVRMVINKIKVVCRAELAKMLKERPRGFVVPASGDDADRQAARIGDSIYDYLYSSNVLDLAYQLEQALFWLVTCGVGFEKVYYDKSKMDFSGAMGSIMVEPVSPWHIRVPDLLQVDLEKQPYFIHEVAKDTEWLNDTYKVKLTPNSASTVSTENSRFLNSIGINQELNKNQTTVKEFWLKPNKNHPEGFMVTIADDNVLGYVDGNPYSHGMYPVTKYDHIPTGKFYSDSTIVDLIPVQKEFNRTFSQIVEAKNKTSKPSILSPLGSIDPNKVTSEPGLIIEYRPGTAPPQIMEPPAQPSYVINLIEVLQAQFNDISSQHEVSKGSTPPGVTAATAISYLQEEDDSKLSLSISSIERGTQKIGKQVLALANQFWGEARQIQIVGEDAAYDLKQYTREDMKGNTDFRVEVGSATPRSRAAKQAFIMELMDRGAISPQDGLKYLNMAETSKLYDDSQVDARAAQKENNMFVTGEIQTQWDRNDWDNDLVHIQEHDTFRKKQGFDSMPPDQQSLLSQHVNMHKFHIAAKFGRMDLLPQMDPATGAIGESNPMLDGFIEGLRSGVIPAIIPPPPPSPGELAMQAHQAGGAPIG